MCIECFPSMSRRHAIGLLAGVAVAVHSTRRSAVPAPPPAPVPVADGLSIMPRDAWAGGREPTGPLAPETDVRFLLVHHTASANGDDPVKVMRVAYDFHTGPEKGWPDVAYNFFIDQFGAVWEGRKGSLAGPVEASATGGSQGFAQLVCLLGDFTSQLPTEAALASLNRTLAWLAARSNIATAPGSTTQFVSRGSNRWPAGTSVTAATISGHRDMSQTACPGDTFYPYLVANVPAQVTELVNAATPSTTLAPPTSSAPPTSAAPAPTTSEAASTTMSAADTSANSAPAAPSIAAPDVAAAESTVSVTSEPPMETSSSGRDIGSPALIVTAGAAVAGAALLARRRRQSTDLSPPDTNTGAPS
jgi:hypothetical protein